MYGSSLSNFTGKHPLDSIAGDGPSGNYYLTPTLTAYGAQV